MRVHEFPRELPPVGSLVRFLRIYVGHLPDQGRMHGIGIGERGVVVASKVTTASILLSNSGVVVEVSRGCPLEVLS